MPRKFWKSDSKGYVSGIDFGGGGQINTFGQKRGTNSTLSYSEKSSVTQQDPRSCQNYLALLLHLCNIPRKFWKSDSKGFTLYAPMII